MPGLLIYDLSTPDNKIFHFLHPTKPLNRHFSTSVRYCSTAEKAFAFSSHPTLHYFKEIKAFTKPFSLIVSKSS